MAQQFVPARPSGNHIPAGPYTAKGETTYRPGSQDFLEVPSLESGQRKPRTRPFLMSSHIPANSIHHQDVK